MERVLCDDSVAIITCFFVGFSKLCNGYSAIYDKNLLAELAVMNYYFSATSCHTCSG